MLNKGGQYVFNDGGRLAKTDEIVCPSVLVSAGIPAKLVVKTGLKLWSPELQSYALLMCHSECCILKIRDCQ